MVFNDDCSTPKLSRQWELKRQMLQVVKCTDFILSLSSAVT